MAKHHKDHSDYAEMGVFAGFGEGDGVAKSSVGCMNIIGDLLDYDAQNPDEIMDKAAVCLEEIIQVLKETLLQIEFLQEKFHETATSEAVLRKGRAILGKWQLH
jgi:hypothetical protein